MKAGKLRHRITITQKTVSSQNSFGEDVTSTQTVGTFWAFVRGLQGSEVEKAMQKWPEAQYTILMRYQPGITITPEMSISWKGRTLDILDVDDTDAGATTDPRMTLIARDFQG